VKYSGTLDIQNHKWLSGKKIFIDPGHGALGLKDKGRIADNGLTEEEINLKTALILEDMLKRSGASVKMSRYRDEDISLDKRVDMIREFEPSLLVSIHHNASPRKKDNVNYPSVFIWGSRFVNPAGFDFAKILLDEFHRVMDERGHVVSDFTVFSETGTKILRETINICPGVIGEMGFFSSPNQAIRYADILYNEMEAEAWFKAVSKYIQFGTPGAEILFSTNVDNSDSLNLIKDRNSMIAVKFNSGNELQEINSASLSITIDGLPAGYKKFKDNIYMINYGKTLYPGGHRIRISFRNQRGMSSPILNAGFTVEINKGDFDYLVKRGRQLILECCYVREGLKMLLSAYYMSPSDPGSRNLALEISNGFRLIGEYQTAEYYLSKAKHFYPDTALRQELFHNTASGYRFPVEFHGKKMKVTGNAEILNLCR
jgi:N-acetylmuramoyl-L-alanine amidase